MLTTVGYTGLMQTLVGGSILASQAGLIDATTEVDRFRNIRNDDKGDYPIQFDVSYLNGTNGFTVNTTKPGYAGSSVSSAGDVNGDGIDDMIIGAPKAGTQYAGQAYVIFGQRNGFFAEFDLSALNGTNGFTINGANARNLAGSSVSNAGDVNGDGIDDVMVGSPFANAGSGEVSIIFGSQHPFAANMNLSVLNGVNGFTLSGGTAGASTAGGAVSGAGDVNGDGIDDVIVGAMLAFVSPFKTHAGKAYVVFGSKEAFPAKLNLESLTGDNGFIINGAEMYAYTGISVARAGDVNGDGIDDVIIGADANGQGRGVTGKAYVIFGSKKGFPQNINLSKLDSQTGFTLEGKNDEDATGCSVDTAGDINDDGIDDVIIGARYAHLHSGSAYVVFGNREGFPATLELSNLNGKNGFTVIGDNAFSVGSSVSTAGDFNGDGIDDVAMGTGTYSGNAFLLFGSKAGFSSTIKTSALNGTNGFMVEGLCSYSPVSVVSEAGDVNNDGIIDVMIGAPCPLGETYVIYGGVSLSDATLTHLQQTQKRKETWQAARTKARAWKDASVNALVQRGLFKEEHDTDAFFVSPSPPSDETPRDEGPKV